MSLFKAPSDPFPRWVRFPGAPCLEVAQRLGLGPGDGISVRLGEREVPMDLLVLHSDSFIVQDPDGTSHPHEWSDAVSYWKRIGPTRR